MFPLKKIVLFKHGVGYFERQKELIGEDASVDFFFKETQMNDVLKSLTAVDVGGGVVSSISYQTQIPLNQTLDSLSLKLSDEGTASLTELLQQSVGGIVTLSLTGGTTVTGAVIGVEDLAEEMVASPVTATSSSSSSSSSSSRAAPLTSSKSLHLLTEDCSIRTFPITSVRSFVYRDPSLKADLQHLMVTLLNMKKKDLKKVTVFTRALPAPTADADAAAASTTPATATPPAAAAPPSRTCIASYVIESPVWKTSYRLQLALVAQKAKVEAEAGAAPVDLGWKEGKEEKKGEEAKKPAAAAAPASDKKSPTTPLTADGSRDISRHFIQGWCLVDNTMDEDWDRVALTLIGGRPNAFKHDLYGPRFRKRPVLQVQEQAPPKPPVLADVLPHHKESLLREAPALLSSLDAGGPRIGQIPSEEKVKERSIAASEYDRPVATMKEGSIRQVKPVDVFQYAIPKPVSVKRGQSALVPFLSEEFSGESCSLFSPSVNATNPLSVILFKNTFGVTLDGGPITIYDEDTCIGEAMLESIRPGDDKFLPYGVDKQVKGSSTDSSSYLPYHRASISHGVLTSVRWQVFDRTYSFDHTGGTHMPHLYIEHRFKKGDYSLWDTKEVASKTENFYRFVIRANAGEITLFSVKERTEESITNDIRGASKGDADRYLAFKWISEEAYTAIVTDLIPFRERVARQSALVSRTLHLLNEALRVSNSSRNQINNNLDGYGGYNGHDPLWASNEITVHTLTWATQMIAAESQVRRYREEYRVASLQLAKDQTEYELKIARFTDSVTIPVTLPGGKKI